MKTKPTDVVEGGSYIGTDGVQRIVTRVYAKGRGFRVVANVSRDGGTWYEDAFSLERFRKLSGIK